MRYFIILIFALIVSGCSIKDSVYKERQEELADFNEDEQEQLHNEHVYRIKEGSSGGFEEPDFYLEGKSGVPGSGKSQPAGTGG